MDSRLPQTCYRADGNLKVLSVCASIHMPQGVEVRGKSQVLVLALLGAWPYLGPCLGRGLSCQSPECLRLANSF